MSVDLDTGFFISDALMDSFDNLDGTNDNKIRFASVDLDINLAALLEFKGTVTLLDNQFSLKLGTFQSCVDFQFGPLNPPSSCYTLPNLNPSP